MVFLGSQQDWSKEETEAMDVMVNKAVLAAMRHARTAPGNKVQTAFWFLTGYLREALEPETWERLEDFRIESSHDLP